MEDSKKSWRFSLKVLESSASEVQLCVEDQALNGASYHTQKVLSVIGSGENGILKAEKKVIVLKECPEYAK